MRNKLGLWLDSSICKSLAAGSKRYIRMVSLLIVATWLIYKGTKNDALDAKMTKIMNCNVMCGNH